MNRIGWRLFLILLLIGVVQIMCILAIRGYREEVRPDTIARQQNLSQSFVNLNLRADELREHINYLQPIDGKRLDTAQLRSVDALIGHISANIAALNKNATIEKLFGTSLAKRMTAKIKAAVAEATNAAFQPENSRSTVSILKVQARKISSELAVMQQKVLSLQDQQRNSPPKEAGFLEVNSFWLILLPLLLGMLLLHFTVLNYVRRPLAKMADTISKASFHSDEPFAIKHDRGPVEIKNLSRELELFGQRMRMREEERTEALEAATISISELNVELSDSLERLETAQEENLRSSKMAQLGQLTATVAHEMRNPLGAIKTSVFLLERKLGGETQGFKPQFTKINKSVARCNSIIVELLDFARTKKVNRDEHIFDAWTQTTVEEIQEQISSKVNVVLRLQCGNARCSFDENKLRRAYVNLISNAADAVVAKFEEEENSDPSVGPELVVTTFCDDAQFGFSVSDNGPGIPEDVLARIREPLFTTKSFGVGLGVPAVDQIALEHDGKLDINGGNGRSGATFTMTIPHYQHPPAEEALPEEMLEVAAA